MCGTLITSECPLCFSDIFYQLQNKYWSYQMSLRDKISLNRIWLHLIYFCIVSTLIDLLIWKLDSIYWTLSTVYCTCLGAGEVECLPTNIISMQTMVIQGHGWTARHFCAQSEKGNFITSRHLLTSAKSIISFNSTSCAKCVCRPTRCLNNHESSLHVI